MAGIFHLLLGRVQQAVASAVDPFFNYVTALLHGDGTNGAQNNTFLDSSTNNFTITRNGNTTQGTFSPFSQTGWSNYFDGTANYAISAPAGAAFAFGTGDFTVEGWIYTTNLSSENFIFDTRSSASTAGMGFSIEPNTGKLRYSGSANNVLTSVGITANTWYHVAWVRSGTTLTGYINGVNCGTATNSDNITQNNGVVGRVAFSTASSTGYLSNVRVVKGTAVYTSNFTPSTTPLTAISGTSLLTCQANRFLDASSNAFAITVTGSPSVQAFSPFNPTSAWSASSNGGSGYFDGSGDYLSITGGVTNAGTGDFTLEAWVYYTGDYSNYGFVFDSRTSAGSFINGFNVAVNITNGYWYAGFSTQELLTNIPAAKNSWTHVAVTRSGTTMRLFVNGAIGATYTTSNNLTSTTNFVGTYYAANGYYFPGYISDLRAVKGTAVYTAAFTPPTAPLTAITNTSLLLNYTNAGIYDNAAVGDYETVGNAQVSTAVVKYGTGSMYFDGTGDWLAAPVSNTLKYGTGDLTIEGWFYNSAAQQAVSGLFSYLSGATYFVLHNNTATYPNQLTLWVDAYSASPVIIGGVTTAQSTWYHYALNRTAGIWKLYLNGTQIGSSYTNSAEPVPANSQFRLGLGNNSGGAGSYTGYIDDFRITKGVGRYPYNFTPPAAAFPNIGGTVTLTADPYFRNTTLLLPGNGTNGAQNNTFLDSSSNAFTITRNGNTTQGNFSPFSQTGWGAYFDGSSAWLSVASNAAFGMGTGDATLECWYYPTNSTVGIQTLIDIRTTNTGVPVVIGVLASGAPYAYNGTTYSGGTVANNYWNHIAFVRSGGGSNNCKLYLNGTQVAQFTDTADWGSADTCAIGRNTAFAGEYALGYISNVRVVKGTAVYTGNFTPSTTPLTAISGTSLLTCQSNRFVDNSSNAFSLTVTGSPSVQAFSPFAPTAAWSASTNGGSGYFDGSGDYLNTASNAAFAMGSGNFTFEMWVYSGANGTGTRLAGNGTGGSWAANRWVMATSTAANPNKFTLAINNATPVDFLVSTSTFNNNQWMHVAISRSGNAWAMWVNGAREAYVASNSAALDGGTSEVFNLGFSNLTGDSAWAGYVSGFKMVKGTAVYDPTSTSITVPTAPATNTTNTSLLLSATNGGIVDATAKNDLETVGNAQISTTQSKFGGSSMYFDGTGDYLTPANNTAGVFGTGDFTIECWVYVTGAPQANQIIWSCLTYPNTTGLYLQYPDATTINIGAGNGSSGYAVVSASTGWGWNQWIHVAVVRYSGTLTLYLNGIARGSASFTNNCTDGLRYIGRPSDTSNYAYQGYIDDFRITKGIARYTSNFTPPTSAFLLQ